MTRRRKKRSKPAGSGKPSPDDAAELESPGTTLGVKIILGIGGILLGFCLLSGVLSVVQQHHAARGAQVVIDELGGKVKHFADSSYSFGKISFAGKPLTDADLARLGAALQGCGGPRELDLSRTQVTDAGLEALRGVDRICVLRLDDTAVAGPGLRHLRLGNTSYDEDWEVLLSLVRTPTTDAGLSNVLHIPKLQVLDLTGTKVTGPGLRQLHTLKQLHSLRLTDCAVDDDGLTVLDGWTTLYTLDLGGTRITDAGLKRIARLKQLQALSLAHTGITDQGLANLAGLNGLTSLALDDTTIGDGALPVVKSVLRLQALSLNGTRVTDTGLQELASWDKLSSLYLERTSITDAGLVHLQRVPSLQRVLLRNAHTTEAGRKTLKQAKPSVLIDW